MNLGSALKAKHFGERDEAKRPPRTGYEGGSGHEKGALGGELQDDFVAGLRSQTGLPKALSGCEKLQSNEGPG